MNKLSTSLLLFVLLVASMAKGQDITVDVKKVQKNYGTKFSKDFKISFTNADAVTKEKVILKATGITAPPILEVNADLTKFEIKFTSSSGKLSTKDKDGKDVSIPNTGFEIFVKEKLHFNVITSNDLVIDITKPDKEYQTDYSQSFKISFTGGDATLRKIRLKHNGANGDTTVNLNTKANLNNFELNFTALDGAPSITDEKGNTVKIEESPFTITVDKVSFDVVNVPVVKVSDGKDSQKKTCIPVQIIDSKMLSEVSGDGACQLCDIRAVKKAIPSKSDRVYSTDYIVIYDPFLKKDAYTICKHVFEKNRDAGQSGYYERYIKIAPKWFQPSVGSQIRFEVINQPVNSTFKLSVDEQDVFNGGASQFAALISSLVNTNIITPVSGAASASKAKDGTVNATGGTVEDTCLLNSLDAVSNQLLEYIIAFKVSSCAIEKHRTNLPLILAKINQQFDLSAMDLEELRTLLAQKIGDEVQDADKKAKALKKVESIVNALKGLQTVTPIAYTTLRAKNRDFIEIKYIGADNVASKPENIRMSGGMKIDFSAGFVLTGLRDFSYALKNTAVNYTPAVGAARDTTGDVIVKEDDGKNQVGVGLLTHFYPRLSSHYNIGGTVGLMTSTSLNLRVMLGGSVLISSLFGSNNRVSFSGGVVWGKVKRLSTQYQDFYEKPRMVNKVPEFYSGASTPPTIDKNEHSWFFAITLNFGGN
jgi:hypothetical protein